MGAPHLPDIGQRHGTFSGLVATLDLVWSLADITMALMAVCNLIAIIFLGKYAIRLLSDYRAQKKAGIQSPVFRERDHAGYRKGLGMLVETNTFSYLCGSLKSPHTICKL